MTTIKRTIEINADVDAALVRVAEVGAQSPSQIIESATAMQGTISDAVMIEIDQAIAKST